MRHQRHIGRAHTANGQIDASGRLGRTAGAGEDHFRIADGVQGLAVIMGDGEIEGINAFQIALIHLVLAAHLVGFAGP